VPFGLASFFGGFVPEGIIESYRIANSHTTDGLPHEHVTRLASLPVSISRAINVRSYLLEVASLQD
jgi:hypothetical protein